MCYNLLRRYRHIVKDFRVRKFRRVQNAHELVMELTLKDDSKLAIKDYLFLDGTRKYAYHWQNKDGSLLIRWDNARHWKNISTFPCNFSISPDNIYWIPAFAGMTIMYKCLSFRRKPESSG